MRALRGELLKEGGGAVRASFSLRLPFSQAHLPVHGPRDLWIDKSEEGEVAREGLYLLFYVVSVLV